VDVGWLVLGPLLPPVQIIVGSGTICPVVAPMLVSPASELPGGEEWAFEVK
jgi:hypothetical protein